MYVANNAYMKIFIYLIFLFLNFNNYSYAHVRGTFSSREEAENKSLELGCEGIHKNQDKWLPCKNEKNYIYTWENRWKN